MRSVALFYFALFSAVQGAPVRYYPAANHAIRPQARDESASNSTTVSQVTTGTSSASSTTSTGSPISNTLSLITTSISTTVASPSSSATSTSPSTAMPSASAPPAPTVIVNSTAPAQPPQSDEQKYVVAHHMVGNTFPYTIDDWKSDIELALANGIDGFALNVGRDSWQPDRVADAYTAAEGTPFKLFLSFDMTSLPCTGPNDAATLRKYITDYATHPNQLIYRGRVFASTFSGEKCTFGQGSVEAGWASQFVKHPDLQGENAVFFVPSFFVDPATFSQFNDVMDGVLGWNTGWPTQLQSNSGSANGLIQQLTQAVTTVVSDLLGGTDADQELADGLSGMSNPDQRTYVPCVSPWFFTHYGADTFNKNWVYYADEFLYPVRWESLVANRTQFDIVEIVTWNDYGESSYIGPIAGAQPNSQAWVDGFDHTAWLNMTAYYAEAFKTGTYPNITEDRIFLWSRPHPKAADAQDDGVGKPDNFDLMSDKVWAVAMLTEPATVVLSTSDGEGASRSFDVPAGVSKLSVPIEAGQTMRARVVRGGQTVVDLDPEFTFEGSPKSYNYNAFVAVS